MGGKASYHTNRDAAFSVCYNEVCLTTDNVLFEFKNKIYGYMLVRGINTPG